MLTSAFSTNCRIDVEISGCAGEAPHWAAALGVGYSPGSLVETVIARDISLLCRLARDPFSVWFFMRTRPRELADSRSRSHGPGGVEEAMSVYDHLRHTVLG